MRIGYQGEIGSNAEEATKRFLQEYFKDSFELIPLTSSKNVIEQLLNNQIDYGVMAFCNSIAGEVIETKEAITNASLEYLACLELPIEHCIFKLKSTDIKDITTIASHLQALKQTKKWRENHLTNVIEKEVEDTALAARLLSEHRLKATTAVICRKNAGFYYNLDLIYENVGDNPNNKTEFKLVKLRR